MGTREGAVCCSQGPATNLSAGVRHQTLVPDPLRVGQFAAEAGVVPGDGGDGHLAPWTPPAALHRHALGPLPGAADVKHLEAVAAVPGGLLLLHLVQADHALRGSLQQGLGQSIPQIRILVTNAALSWSLARVFGRFWIDFPRVENIVLSLTGLSSLLKLINTIFFTSLL